MIGLFICLCVYVFICVFISQIFVVSNILCYLFYAKASLLCGPTDRRSHVEKDQSANELS